MVSPTISSWEMVRTITTVMREAGSRTSVAGTRLSVIVTNFNTHFSYYGTFEWKDSVLQYKVELARRMFETKIQKKLMGIHSRVTISRIRNRLTSVLSVGVGRNLLIIMRSIWLGRSAISRLDRVSRLRIWGLSRLGSRHIGRRQLRLNIRGDEILAACAKSNYRDHINTNNDDTNGDASNSRTNLLGLAGTETGGILGLWNIAVAASTRVFRSRNHWIHTMTNLHANRRGDIPLFRVDKWFIIRRIITTQLGSKTSPTCYTSNTSIRVLINWIAIWALTHANTETSQDIGYLTLGFVVIVLSIHIDTLLVAGLRIGILNIRSATHITSRVYIVISNRFLLRVDFRIVRILDWEIHIVDSSRGIISRIERMRGRWNTSTLRISLWITSISNREEISRLSALLETRRRRTILD